MKFLAAPNSKRLDEPSPSDLSFDPRGASRPRHGGDPHLHGLRLRPPMDGENREMGPLVFRQYQVLGTDEPLEAAAPALEGPSAPAARSLSAYA